MSLISNVRDMCAIILDLLMQEVNALNTSKYGDRTARNASCQSRRVNISLSRNDNSEKFTFDNNYWSSKVTIFFPSVG